MKTEEKAMKIKCKVLSQGKEIRIITIFCIFKALKLYWYIYFYKIIYFICLNNFALLRIFCLKLKNAVQWSHLNDIQIFPVKHIATLIGKILEPALLKKAFQKKPATAHLSLLKQIVYAISQWTLLSPLSMHTTCSFLNSLWWVFLFFCPVPFNIEQHDHFTH